MCTWVMEQTRLTTKPPSKEGCMREPEMSLDPDHDSRSMHEHALPLDPEIAPGRRREHSRLESPIIHARQGHLRVQDDGAFGSSSRQVRGLRNQHQVGYGTFTSSVVAEDSLFVGDIRIKQRNSGTARLVERTSMTKRLSHLSRRMRSKNERNKGHTK